MKATKLSHMLKRDLIIGIWGNWRLYLTALVFFLVLAIFLILQANKYLKSHAEISTLGLDDFLFNIFAGAKPIFAKARQGNEVPFAWMVFHSFLSFIIGFYVYEDIHKSANTVIIKSMSKKTWWTSKFIWCFLSVQLYYLLCLFVGIIFTALFGSFSSTESNEIAKAFWQLSNIQHSFLLSFIVPLIISTAVSTLQITLSLIIKPIYSFIFVLCYLTVSLFYDNVFLLFTHSMVIRTSSYDNATSLWQGILLSFNIIAISFFSGRKIMNKKDII